MCRATSRRSIVYANRLQCFHIRFVFQGHSSPVETGGRTRSQGHVEWLVLERCSFRHPILRESNKRITVEERGMNIKQVQKRKKKKRK